MDHFGELPKFEIKPVIEQTPFESPVVQSFFTKWCEINDAIQPEMVDRRDWEQRGAKGILEKRPDGKQILFIPKDLHLWEMVGVMEAVDSDTFTAKPERQDEAKKKLLELGKTFQGAGIYIAQRLDTIGQGREIASALALEFYDYGRSLIEGKKSEKSESVADIASRALTGQEIEVIDRFLAGDRLYESRRERAEKVTARDPGKKDQFYEAGRQKTLAQFFRASAKAFALSKPPAFLAKVEKAMAQKIETPKRELVGSIFRRGMELLQRNMPFDKLPNYVKDSILHWQNGETTLRDALQIDELRQELKSYRNGEFDRVGLLKLAISFVKRCESLAKKYGNANNHYGREIRHIGYDYNAETGYNLDPFKKIERLSELGQLSKQEIDQLKEEYSLLKLIGDKEREITDKIQRAVSGFPYEQGANNPSEIVANQCINCVGASMLGGALMQEAGLDYLVGDVPSHSILFLVTSDGQVEWRDMLDGSLNGIVTDSMIDGRKKDGSLLTTADIVAFSKNPTPEGLMFDIKSEKYRDKLYWFKEGQRQYVTLFGPEYGQQIQVLTNSGHIFQSFGRYKEAIEAYRQAVAVDPKSAKPYYGLYVVLESLGRHEEAIEAYQRFIDLC